MQSPATNALVMRAVVAVSQKERHREHNFRRAVDRVKSLTVYVGHLRNPVFCLMP